MICDAPPLVFVHIPRTGGTSVETALAPYAREPLRFTTGGNTVLPHKHATARELRALLGPRWAASTTFSVVRDPWERMLSDYHFFREQGPALAPGFSARERALTERALALGFDDWLAACAEALRPCQLDALTDEGGALLVQRVLRQERLDADFSALCAELGLPLTLGRLNASRRPSVARAYSPASRDLIARLCAPDLRAFGYRVPELERPGARGADGC